MMPARNVVTECDGFYISYNPDPSSFFYLITDFESQDETAIVHAGKFFILNGDWRERLSGKTLAECIAVWRENPEHHSDYSNDPDEAR
jgi:hypothetical protein